MCLLCPLLRNPKRRPIEVDAREFRVFTEKMMTDPNPHKVTDPMGAKLNGDNHGKGGGGKGKGKGNGRQREGNGRAGGDREGEGLAGSLSALVGSSAEGGGGSQHPQARDRPRLGGARSARQKGTC